MTTNLDKPLPDVTDPVTAPFWAATKEGRLTVPQCPNCSYRFWPPEPVCPECLGSELDWVDIEPRGTLWSYAVYRRALDPAFADVLPYTVGLIELDGALKMYGIVPGDGHDLTIGQTMTAVFERATDDVTFVRWRPS